MTEIVVGIDPGDKHTGLVTIDGATGALRGHHTVEYDQIIAAVEAFQMIEEKTDDRIYICMEIFQLYPGKQQALAWKQFEVVELIGIIKYLARKQGHPLQMGRPPDVNRFMKKREVPSEIPRSGGGEHQVSAYRLAEYYRIMYLPEAIELRDSQ